MRKTNLSAFKRGYKPANNQELKISLLEDVAVALTMGGQMPDKNKDCVLTGNWEGHGECFVLPDLLLIYRMEYDLMMLPLTLTGMHSDLFWKLEIQAAVRKKFCTAVFLCP